MSNPKSVKEVINGSENFKKFRETVDGYKIVDRFIEIFPDLAKVAKAIKYENGVLFVHADNSVWRSELNLNKHAMIKKINSYLEKEIIKNIKFI